MTITSIKKYKGSSYEVEIDEKKKLYLHIDIICDFGLTSDMEVSFDELKNIVYESNKRKAYQFALYRLDYREYSYKELYNKLMSVYKSQDICEDVMKKLEENGAIDDYRYAQMLARRYIEVKKYGVIRAKKEMYLKGISNDISLNVLEEYSDCEMDNILELIERKYYRFLDDPNDRKNIEKAKAGLVRMGYRFGDINDAVKTYFEEMDNVGG